jgi:signal transduction histidine kinase
LRPRASAELTFTPLDRAGALADGAAQDPQQRAEAKALIESQTERLGNLLGDLRELTRLDLAEGVRPRELALAPFVKGLVDGFRREAAGAGIDLTVTAHGDDAFTDGRLLEMIGSNLISDAIRYTPSGGRVSVRVFKQRNKLVLSVRDTGVGIAPEHQQRVFERLYRVDSTRGKGSEFRAILTARIESPDSRAPSPSAPDTASEAGSIRSIEREPLEEMVSGERSPRSRHDAAL